MASPSENKSYFSPVVNSLIAGSAAGIASILVVSPLDTIRTRLQTNPQFKGALDCAVYVFKSMGIAHERVTATAYGWINELYKSTGLTYLTTVRKEGVTGLYKGMAAPLAAQGVYKAVMFSAYTKAQQIVRSMSGNESGALSLPQLGACGATAGIVNSFVVTPIEMIRNNLQVQYSNAAVPKKGPIDLMKTLVRERGITGLWKGQVATILRDGPGVGAFYVGNETARRYLDANTELGFSSKAILAGMAAGICFWTFALPLDTIKSVVQTDTTNSGMMTLIKNRLATQGLGSFFRGWSVAFTRGIPSAAIVFYTFGTVNKWLSGQ